MELLHGDVVGAIARGAVVQDLLGWYAGVLAYEGGGLWKELPERIRPRRGRRARPGGRMSIDYRRARRASTRGQIFLAQRFEEFRNDVERWPHATVAPAPGFFLDFVVNFG